MTELSRAAQARQAEKVLTRLLKTPKTRAGLVAAVATKSISARFVLGWLSVQLRSGAVLALKSGKTTCYQVAEPDCGIAETPARGLYPPWLDPRVLPATTSSRPHLDGKLVTVGHIRRP